MTVVHASPWERAESYRDRRKGVSAFFQKRVVLAQKAACKITAQGVELVMGKRVETLDAARVAAMVVRCGRRITEHTLPTPDAARQVSWVLCYLGTRRMYDRPVRISIRTYGILVKYGREK